MADDPKVQADAKAAELQKQAAEQQAARDAADAAEAAKTAWHKELQELEAKAKGLIVAAHDEALKLIHAAHDEAEKLITEFHQKKKAENPPATAPVNQQSGK